jgi:hypothetical protein
LEQNFKLKQYQNGTNFKMMNIIFSNLNILKKSKHFLIFIIFESYTRKGTKKKKKQKIIKNKIKTEKRKKP